MPSGEWSAASARVKPATAALVVSYCRLPPPATTERTEATLTMAPPLLRRISGTAALAQKTYPIRLTSRISPQLAALASSTFSYLRMPALLMRMSRCPNFCAAPLTKSRHTASVPTSACVKATLAPAVSSSAATRSPRSPSRSQNATLAPSATKRLTVASPIPDAPPVTAATLPSNRPMFATFHHIAKRASTIRRIHPAGTALLARPGCPTLTDCGSFEPQLSGPFDGLTRSGLGRIEPLPLAWSCDRLRRPFRQAARSDVAPPITGEPFRTHRKGPSNRSTLRRLSSARIPDDGARRSHRDLGRRAADRARCRHDRHRRPAETQGGVVTSPTPGGHGVVRPHALQPAQRQALGCDRADHAQAARDPCPRV